MGWKATSIRRPGAVSESRRREHVLNLAGRLHFAGKDGALRGGLLLLAEEQSKQHDNDAEGRDGLGVSHRVGPPRLQVGDARNLRAGKAQGKENIMVAPQAMQSTPSGFIRRASLFQGKKATKGAKHSKIAASAATACNLPERRISSQSACGAGRSGTTTGDEVQQVARTISIQKAKGRACAASAKKKRVRVTLADGGKHGPYAKCMQWRNRKEGPRRQVVEVDRRNPWHAREQQQGSRRLRSLSHKPIRRSPRMPMMLKQTAGNDANTNPVECLARCGGRSKGFRLRPGSGAAANRRREPRRRSGA